MKATNKCKYYKYNKNNNDNICSVLECVCRGNQSDQKTCLITQLENKCEKYKQALNDVENEAEYLKTMNYGYDELNIKENVVEVANDIIDIISKAKDINVPHKKDGE